MGWIIVGFSLLGLLDFVPVLLEKKPKIIIAYLIFFISAFLLAVCLVKEIPFPYFLYELEKAMKNMGISY